MRSAQRTVLAVAMLLCPAVLAANGCVSNTPAPPAAGLDAALPTADGAPPPQADGTSPEASPADGTVPDAGSTPDANVPPDEGILDAGPDTTDATPPPDAFDAGPMAKLRVAWFDDPSYLVIQSPQGTGPIPRFDACVALHGTNAWQGPLLANVGNPGLRLYDVSSYFDVPAAQYDVRVILMPTGGTATCDAADGGADGGARTADFTNLPALAPNARLTVVTKPIWGSSSAGTIDVVALSDDATVTSGKAKVRFANASNQTTYDYGLGGGAVYSPLFTGVGNVALIASPDADAGTNLSVDSSGYLELDPFTLVNTSIRNGGVDSASSASIDAPSGTILSAFAVLGGLLVCYDGQPSTSSPFLTRCTPVASGGGPSVLRFGNFVADPAFPAIDFCVKYHSMASYGPKPIGTLPGISYGAASARYIVDPGFDYDVRVVAASATDCATALTPDVPYAAPPAGAATLTTLALMGYVVPPDAGVVTLDAGADGGGLSSTAFAAVAIIDGACLGTETPPAVRVVNAASATGAAQDVTLNGTTAWSIANVPYGSVGSAAGADTCGYLAFPAVTNGFLRTSGGGWNYTNTAQVQTLYLFSVGKTVKVLACNDSDATLAACTVLPLGG